MPKSTPNLITQPSILTRSDLTQWLQEDFCESEFKKARKEECLDEAVKKETEAYNPKDECKLAVKDSTTLCFMRDKQ
jgi:hypothetical protein